MQSIAFFSGKLSIFAAECIYSTKRYGVYSTQGILETTGNLEG